MTIDTAKIKAEAKKWGGGLALLTCDESVALCDALDAMRTERDSWQADVESLHRDLAHSMDRITEEMTAVEAEQRRVRVLEGDLAFWEEEAHAARKWLGRLMKRGCVPEEWQRYVSQFAAIDEEGAV